MQVCNADLLEKKAFLEARCGLAEARLADLVEEHRLGVAERDCSIAALERLEAATRERGLEEAVRVLEEGRPILL